MHEKVAMMKVSYLAMTAYEGPAPGIEIWPAPSEYCHSEVAVTSMEHTLDLCVKADALGFDWVSVSEHHYAPYMMTPNPIVMAAALTQRVKRAKIALLGPLLPLLNPVRLAEEIAMLDCLSGGRVVVLFLRGTPNEHKTYDTPGDQTRGMTEEGIDLICKAWREPAPFSWEGKYYRFQTISVWPRLSQLPHPPLYGSGNSKESVLVAAQKRLGIAFSFMAPENCAELISFYKAEAAKAGWQPTADQVIYRGLAYVADSNAQAMDDMGAFFGARSAEQAKLTSTTMGGPPVVPLILQPYFVGDPQIVTDRFRVLHDIGVGVVDLVFGIGTHTQQSTAIERFAKSILPKLHSWDTTGTPLDSKQQLAGAIG
jgi:alkanesulfonate monooxygenase SsuD/methylene tetrahydromethanopterin reductase-like flavin-dependent oxidoreductase (luciferase family)